MNADATPDTFAATADTSNDGDRFKGMKEIGSVEMDTNGWILPPGATAAPTSAAGAARGRWQVLRSECR